MIKPADLKEMILEIESSEVQKIKRNTKIETFELKPDPLLLADLSGNTGALLIRAILSRLNADEHHVFKWRLENKYKQYQILNYYIPGCMPETLSFSKLLNQYKGVQKIKALFLKGFFLKQTLGDATFFTNSWDKTAEFENIAKIHRGHCDKYETYMLQKKLALKCEFRVHTFGKEIIPGLIYRVQGQKPPNNHADAEKFLEGILEKLPDVILKGSLIGWDIGLTSDDEYYIIEANFTGFHPEYRAGFQTSGYTDMDHFGPIVCAWLNLYFKSRFGISISSIDSSLLENYPFYKMFMFYRSILKNKHLEMSKSRPDKSSVCVIIYWVEYIDILLVSLISHFQMVSFIEFYYVITSEERFKQTSDILGKNTNVRIIAENTLFTKEGYQSIQKLSYAKRKLTSCKHVINTSKYPLHLII